MTQAVSRRTLMGGAALGTAFATLPSSVFGAAAPSQAVDPQTAFPLIANGVPATIWIDADADSAVRHVATDFAADLERVSGTAARLIDGASDAVRGPVVIIGVLGTASRSTGSWRRARSRPQTCTANGKPFARSWSTIRCRASRARW